MTQKTDIYNFISLSLGQTATLSDLYSAFPFPKPSIRRVVNTGVKKGDLVRVAPSTYRLAVIYYKIAQTKTGKYKGKNRNGENSTAKINAVISGWIRSDKIDMKRMKVDEQVKINLNSVFISIIRDKIFDYENLLLGLLESENLSFEIEGTEIRENDINFIRPNYDPNWNIEIIELEIQGYHYVITKNELVRINEHDLY